MNVRKTMTVVLAASALAFSLAACGSSTDDQRASAIAVLQKQGYQDVRYNSEDLSPPFGDGTVYFTARLGDCRQLDLGVRAGRDIVFRNLSKAQTDAFFSKATTPETLGMAIARSCRAPVG